MLLLANVLGGLGWVLYWFLQLYMYVLIARAVVSWVSADPRNPIVHFLYSATEPAVRVIRRRLPTSRFRYPHLTGRITPLPLTTTQILAFSRLAERTRFVSI